MQFAKSTDYALHALVHLAISEQNNKIGIKELAEMLNVSESYLSKIMTQLRKDGLVRAVPGVKGGYKLSRPANQITFLDVIFSTEGGQEMFVCSNSNSKQHRAVINKAFESNEQEPICMIKEVMDQAENALHDFLKNQTIQTIADKKNKSHHASTHEHIKD